MSDRGRNPLAGAAWALAATAFLLHVLLARRYGYFGDELYFLACARRLAWGYVDMGPGSIVLLRAWTDVAGESLLAIRLVPALCAGALVLLTAALARRLGGGTAAQGLAALAVVVGPGFLVIDHYYSMNAIDLVVWALTAHLAIDAIEHDRTRPWLALGVVLALGLTNRLSVLWLAGGLVLGVLATHPSSLRRRGPWLAAALVVTMAVPLALWQAAHGWPTLEFVRRVLASKLVPVTLAGFVRNQALLVHPLVFPVAALGLLRLLAGPAAVLGVVYLTTAALLLGVGASKAYYMLGAYPPLLAAGAVAIEASARRWHRPWLPRLAAGALALGGLAGLPLALPVLPVDRLVAYERLLAFDAPTEDRRVTGSIPGHFANMEGWPEIVESVAAVSRTIPIGTRSVVLADDYMEAGALEVLGARAGLPPVTATHNTWALWPTDGERPDAVVLVGGIADRAAPWFDRVEIVGRIACTHCLPWRVGRPIAVGHGLRIPLARVVAETRHFD